MKKPPLLKFIAVFLIVMFFLGTVNYRYYEEAYSYIMAAYPIGVYLTASVGAGGCLYIATNESSIKYLEDGIYTVTEKASDITSNTISKMKSDVKKNIQHPNPNNNNNNDFWDRLKEACRDELENKFEEEFIEQVDKAVENGYLPESCNDAVHLYSISSKDYSHTINTIRKGLYRNNMDYDEKIELLYDFVYVCNDLESVYSHIQSLFDFEEYGKKQNIKKVSNSQYISKSGKEQIIQQLKEGFENEIKESEVRKNIQPLIIEYKRNIQDIGNEFNNLYYELGENQIKIQVNNVNPKETKVTAYVSVMDGANRPIANLQNKNAFNLKDNDKKVQKHDVFYIENPKITKQSNIAVLLDTSESMKNDPIKQAKIGARGFIERLKNNEKVTLIGFDGQVKVLERKSTNKNNLYNKIDSLQASGDTALYDSILKAYNQLKNKKGNKTIILLSDGHDEGSSTSFNNVLNKVSTGNVSIFSIALGKKDSNFHDGNLSNYHKKLKALSKAAGGKCFEDINPMMLNRLYGKISKIMQHQYKLNYIPADYTSTSENKRKLIVKVEYQSPENDIKIKDSATIKYKPALDGQEGGKFAQGNN